MLNRPETKFATLGTDLVAMPPAQFSEPMRRESKQFGETIKRFSIKST